MLMPRLVTLTEVQPIIGLENKKMLDIVGFDTLELEAAKIIRDRTGIVLPDSAASRPADLDWVITPAAWIIQWLTTPRLPIVTEESRRLWQRQYDDALAMLRLHVVTPTTSTGAAHIGIIDGLED